MVLHSFTRLLQNSTLLLSLTLFRLSNAWLTGSCTPDFGSQDVLRIELNSNIWASNSSLASQRGVYLWIGNQEWRMDVNSQPSPYPILTILSTSHNQTYISTSPNGAQDAPCPNSYSYNSNVTSPDDDPFGGGCCTFNSSYTCHGYYDLTTSTPIYLETATNFTGSPEDSTTAAEVQGAGAKYGNTYLGLVLPETYKTSSQSGVATSIGHYGTGSQVFGFVNMHEEQVLGLGMNSTFLNTLYDGGYIASRSIGLYYGVPAAAGAQLERNGSMIMGGYSTSRLQGNFSSQTYPIGSWTLPRHCPWEVDVSRISSDTETSTTAFTACIEPSELSVVLPASVYSQLTSSSTNTSDLTITLTNGLVAKIPSSLVSMRAATDSDQSPILGAPFLSQVYLFADYQEKTLSTGLANNTLNFLTGGDQLQCIEHANSTGDLGWAVGSPVTGSVTTSATSATSTSSTKKGGTAGRSEGSSRTLGMLVVGLCIWVVL